MRKKHEKTSFCLFFKNCLVFFVFAFLSFQHLKAAAFFLENISGKKHCNPQMGTRSALR